MVSSEGSLGHIQGEMTQGGGSSVKGERTAKCASKAPVLVYCV